MGNSAGAEEQDEDVFDEKYNLEKKLGSGAFGEVFLCSSREDSDETYAVKVIDTYSEANAESFQTAAEEADLMQTLDHEYIVGLIETFQGERFLKVVMELVDGGELFKVIQDPNLSFSDNDVRQVSGQVLSGLAYLHKSRVVHRDVKAENVMLSDAYRPGKTAPNIKLIDFGMAAKLEGGWFYEEQQLSLVCGTPHYIAPEIWSSMPGVPEQWVEDYGSQYGPKVDVWAAGVLVYLMIIGQYPYNGESQQELATQACSQEVHPDYVPAYRPSNYSMPPKGRAFLEQLMEPDQDARLSARDAIKDPWLQAKKKRALDPMTQEMRANLLEQTRMAAALKFNSRAELDAETQREREAAFLAECNHNLS